MAPDDCVSVPHYGLMGYCGVAFSLSKCPDGQLYLFGEIARYQVARCESVQSSERAWLKVPPAPWWMSGALIGVALALTAIAAWWFRRRQEFDPIVDWDEAAGNEAPDDEEG